jgi:MYXO-CTERM domain-containing protein
VGVIEVSDQGTKFVPITSRNKLTGAVLAGVVLGAFLSWRRRRK